MAKFKVKITEALSRIVEIEAIDSFDAYCKADDMWKNSEVILDADDFDGVDFIVKEVVE